MKKTEKAARGQTIFTETAPQPEKWTPKGDDPLMGKKFGGGPRDMSHSLGSGETTFDYMDTPAKGGDR